MSEEYIDVTVHKKYVALSSEGLIFGVSFIQRIPGHGAIEIGPFRFVVPYGDVAESMDVLIRMICEVNPGLAALWLEELSRVLLEVKEDEKVFKESIVDDVERGFGFKE